MWDGSGDGLLNFSSGSEGIALGSCVDVMGAGSSAI